MRQIRLRNRLRERQRIIAQSGCKVWLKFSCEIGCGKGSELLRNQGARYGSNQGANGDGEKERTLTCVAVYFTIEKYAKDVLQGGNNDGALRNKITWQKNTKRCVIATEWRGDARTTAT